MKKIIFLVLVLVQFGGIAQEYFPKNNGLKETNSNYTAFINAAITLSPGETLKKGTLLIKEGSVIAAGKSVSIPDNAVIIDLNGKHIYPSFIDTYSNFGIEKPKRSQGGGRSPQYEASREGFYWNDHIMPEQEGISFFKYDAKKAKELRSLGFGVVQTHQMDGIARGTGVLVALNDTKGNETRILNDRSGQFFSFSKSVTSRQSYPGSLMGSMALLRQMYYDADWYSKGHSKTKDRSLEALLKNKNKVSFIEAGNKGNNLRADNISDLFNLNYIIVGGGDEYEAIDAIKATQATYILPLNFPSAFDVTDAYAAKYIALEDMREWNQAPANPATLEKNDITFAFTLHKLKKTSDFTSNVQKAITYGLSEEKALAALTTVPAKILGEESRLGQLKAGYLANFLITSGPLFHKETVIYENWTQGQKSLLKPMPSKDIRGTYTLTSNANTYTLEVTGSEAKPSAQIKQGETEYKTTLSVKENWITLSFTHPDTKELYRAKALIDNNSSSLAGKLIMPNATETNFNAQQTKPFKEEKKKKEKSASSPEVVPVTYPNVGYGFTTKPKTETILFKNATVWTGEDQGILENTDVLIKNGTISKIGKNLSGGGAITIDATGKHLTAGIIDEHSHIAALSINEGGHNSSAEVKIGDVLNPEDINIYRNLAGGVTTIQILHGSANPIGGQSAIIKLKWGEDSEGLKYKDAPKFIKFALGENVKQSNWQSYNRFPQTRMGVEQLYVNYFNRAKAYEAKKNSGEAYRVDEEMEVLSEILKGERFISCHSYVQSEINMLMKVAEKFNFNINTFTHILEGYKVADKMAAHGVGGSTFSDWWAYKYEVNDAIPYNASIMASQGVTVAINSDDDEMSRRLNQEAAKSVKYGGMTDEEVWKMVTINPAKLLHIDDKVGSIKEGKDADVVLWNGSPLSVYSKAERTIIEGVTYFDLDTDQKNREAIKAEKVKLINLMRSDKGSSGNKRTPMKKDKINFECETIN